ncbi:MAG: hypothetical protein [Wendovervirus sonii]|uniref:DUF1540 domain-containing protein n=1 Tax=phage Lak_Megaphage_Sonny TaxID=3109229 RepID=A0ABZ0Z3J7_9CAUD|nr:MAG: hypothetical protein [phage Lak_Megaphage_Sonny]
MKYNCENCVINNTCTLVKNGNELQCMVNAEYAPKIAVNTHSSDLVFVSDKDTDYTKYEGYSEDD